MTISTADNTTGCVDFMIIDDNALEGDQTFIITLTSSVPVVANETVVTITDNDC